jgi:phosphoribosylanthranilate isomerase
MIIKVCGMRDAANIRAVDGLPVDLMGFIFWPRSSRYVSRRPDYLPTRCKRVGVFVDADITDVLRHVADYALDYVQLHGSESPAYLRQLRAALPATAPSLAATAPSLADGGFPAIIKAFSIATAAPSLADGGFPAIIKAFSIATAADLRQTSVYHGLADLFLFDTKGPSAGGNGRKFDWSVLSAYAGPTPFLLSGGIGPADAEALRQLPLLDGFPVEYFYGIDLNSRFELAPGLKDIHLLQDFIKTIHP